MKKLNQKGFGALGVVLIILVLAIVGGAGYFVYSNQNKTKTDGSNQTNQQSSDKQDSKQKTEVVDVDDAVSQIGDKIIELSSGKFKVEEVKGQEGPIPDIKISDTESVKVANENFINYLTMSINVDSGTYGPEDYAEYGKNIRAAEDSIKSFIVDDLGLSEVYTYVTVTPSMDEFRSVVYKVGDYYIELTSGNGFTVTWAK